MIDILINENFIDKPILTSNPITLQKDQQENMASKVEKARQGLLLLKSKINKQATFSNGAFNNSVFPSASKAVKFSSAIKPTLTSSNFRKTFKPDFSEKKSKEVSKSISFNNNFEHKLSLESKTANVQNPPSNLERPQVTTITAPASEKFFNPSSKPAAKKPLTTISPIVPEIAPKPDQNQSKISFPESTQIQSSVVTASQTTEFKDPDTGEIVKLYPCDLCNTSQRIVSEEQESIVKHEKVKDQKFNGLKSKKFNNASAGGLNAKWKSKSELFRAAMKAARTGEAVEMPIDEDLHQCPYCKRTFNENAAHKHIKMCQERSQMMEHRMKSRKDKGPSMMTKPQLSKRT